MTDFDDVEEAWDELLSKPNRRQAQDNTYATHKAHSNGSWVPRQLKRENRKNRDRKRNQEIRDIRD